MYGAWWFFLGCGFIERDWKLVVLASCLWFNLFLVFRCCCFVVFFCLSLLFRISSAPYVRNKLIVKSCALPEAAIILVRL